MLTSHEIEDILDRFRESLREADEELQRPEIVSLAEQLARPDQTNGAAGRDSLKSVGLMQVAEAFTSLRHEIKLQTKGLRGLQDQIQTEQQTVEGAVDELRAARRESVKTAEESVTASVRPLIISLLDIDEALGQAVKTTEQQAAHRQQSAKREALLEALENDFRELPAWKRVWLTSFQRGARRYLEEAIATSSEPDTSDTIEGLRMLRARLRRALSEAEVEPMRCLGERVDPRLMRVIEVVDGADHPPETVVEEIRAGYQWKGVTLRVAEVRATKSAGNP